MSIFRNQILQQFSIQITQNNEKYNINDLENINQQQFNELLQFSKEEIQQLQQKLEEDAKVYKQTSFNVPSPNQQIIKQTDKYKLIKDFVSFKLEDPYNENTLVKLNMAKDLFAQELPRMPRDYITRLVFDMSHESIILFEVPSPFNLPVAAITYRKFPEVKLIEIAFCAVNSIKKNSGYGTIIMNELKDHIIEQGYTDIVTYADNTAQEYFFKQGFNKNVSINENVWLGRIKHYEGAKFVHCPLYDKIKYTQLNQKLDIIRDKLINYYNIPTFTGSQTQELLDYLKQNGNLSEYQIASDEEITKVCNVARLSILKAIRMKFSYLFLFPEQNIDQNVQVVPNSLQQMLEKCDKKFYRTRDIFVEDSKSIYERVEARYNDSKYCDMSKQCYEFLIKNFDYYWKTYNQENYTEILEKLENVL